MRSLTSQFPTSLLRASFSTNGLDPGTWQVIQHHYVPGTELGLEERPRTETCLLLAAVGTETFNSNATTHSETPQRRRKGCLYGICVATLREQELLWKKKGEERKTELYTVEEVSLSS